MPKALASAALVAFAMCACTLGSNESVTSDEWHGAVGTTDFRSSLASSGDSHAASDEWSDPSPGTCEPRGSDFECGCTRRQSSCVERGDHRYGTNHDCIAGPHPKIPGVLPGTLPIKGQPAWSMQCSDGSCQNWSEACRGACGAGCGSSPDVPSANCARDYVSTTHATRHGFYTCRYERLACATHPGCQAHDLCMEQCREHDLCGATGSATLCQSQCHSLALMMATPFFYCVANWATGSKDMFGECYKGTLTYTGLLSCTWSPR